MHVKVWRDSCASGVHHAKGGGFGSLSRSSRALRQRGHGLDEASGKSCSGNFRVAAKEPLRISRSGENVNCNENHKTMGSPGLIAAARKRTSVFHDESTQSQRGAKLPNVPQAAAAEARMADTVDTKRARESLLNEAGVSENDYGLKRGFREHFKLGKQLGVGGTSVVYEAVPINKVHSLNFGEKLAVKVTPKTPGSHWNRTLQERRQEILNEEFTLKKLSSTLNVVQLEAIYEDDEYVYLVMEQCGSELLHQIGAVPYTEGEVARIMRAVLRTLGQMHKHHLIHRDVKPNNFMVRDCDSPKPVIKAIDFGLSTHYIPGRPLEHAVAAGTPWYLAPETLSCQYGPAADCWAAGVMAYQLLSGNFPFNDKRNPWSPAMSAVYKSILTDPLKFRGEWECISDEAKDLVMKLLEKDPEKRLTASQALQHPWVRKKGKPGLGRSGRKIPPNTVQCLQQFAMRDVFSQIAYEMFVEELRYHCEESSPIREKLNAVESTFHEFWEGSNAASSNTSDTLCDGISYEELHNMLERFKLTLKETARLIPRRYPNRGRISKLQFVSAFLNIQEIMDCVPTKQIIDLTHSVFRRLDNDGDGDIGKDDLEVIFFNRIHDNEFRSAFMELACTIDGREDACVALHSGELDAMRIDFKSFMVIIFGPEVASSILLSNCDVEERTVEVQPDYCTDFFMFDDRMLDDVMFEDRMLDDGSEEHLEHYRKDARTS